MTTAELLETLRRLETELHDVGTRRNVSRLARLLHADFEEFGRSGRKYSRAEVLAEFSAGGDLPNVVSRDFRVAILAENVALLTYFSAHSDPAGNLYRHTLRASLWVLNGNEWQMRFHQGTPVEG